MKKNNLPENAFMSNLKKGLDISFKRLVKSKQQTNDVLAFSENGKIVKVKAKDIKL